MKQELIFRKLHPLDVEALEIVISDVENQEWFKKLSPKKKLEFMEAHLNTYEFLRVRLALSFRELFKEIFSVIKSVDWVDFGMTILAVLISLGFFFGMFGSAIIGVYNR